MKKIKLLLEYDGTAYHGWQIQKEGLTLQGVIEEKIFSITDSHSRVIGASRTDAGVHALGQVATFRTESKLDFGTMKKALNALLPQDIRILDVSEVDDSLHPRNDVRRKGYFYIISNQKKPSAFVHKYAWTARQFLDSESMVEASHILIGRYDFSSFMGAGSGAWYHQIHCVTRSRPHVVNHQAGCSSLRASLNRPGGEGFGARRNSFSYRSHAGRLNPSLRAGEALSGSVRLTEGGQAPGEIRDKLHGSLK